MNDSNLYVLQVCPDRYEDGTLIDTGFYVRAQNPDGKMVSVDIVRLDRDSLHRWLRSRGGKNLWAENVILRLFEHEMVEEED